MLLNIHSGGRRICVVTGNADIVIVKFLTEVFVVMLLLCISIYW